jgi:hypothetical protein
VWETEEQRSRGPTRFDQRSSLESGHTAGPDAHGGEAEAADEADGEQGEGAAAGRPPAPADEEGDEGLAFGDGEEAPRDLRPAGGGSARAVSWHVAGGKQSPNSGRPIAARSVACPAVEGWLVVSGWTVGGKGGLGTGVKRRSRKRRIGLVEC